MDKFKIYFFLSENQAEMGCMNIPDQIFTPETLRLVESKINAGKLLGTQANVNTFMILLKKKLEGRSGLDIKFYVCDANSVASNIKRELTSLINTAYGIVFDRQNQNRSQICNDIKNEAC